MLSVDGSKAVVERESVLGRLWSVKCSCHVLFFLSLKKTVVVLFYYCEGKILLDTFALLVPSYNFEWQHSLQVHAPESSNDGSVIINPCLWQESFDTSFSHIFSKNRLYWKCCGAMVPEIPWWWYSISILLAKIGGGPAPLLRYAFPH